MRKAESLSPAKPEAQVTEVGLALVFPGAFVGDGQRVEVAGRGGSVVDPFAQQRRAVDHVDRQLVELIFVREVAPQLVVGLEPPDRLEGERLQPPRLERLVVVERPFGVDEHAAAQLADMLVEGRLERRRRAACSRRAIRGASRSISAMTSRGSMSGAPNSSSGRVVPLPSLKRRAFEHHRAGIGARHVEVGGVGAGVDPDALGRPAEARRRRRAASPPSRSRDNRRRA